MSRRRQIRAKSSSPQAVRVRASRCRVLLVIDNAPLQAGAWRELQIARRKLDKATRDLHRHEEVDEPGFRTWLATTFPTLVSSARELAQEVESKSRFVNAVETEALYTGRSARSIWRRWQRAEAEAAKAASDAEKDAGSGDAGDADGFDDGGRGDPWDEVDDPWDEVDDGFADAFRAFTQAGGGFEFPSADGRFPEDKGRDIYRRLVQNLHPDRGGEWTPARERLWHQVQEAWENRDADMLARLEAEWDIAADTLGPASAFGRLRAALAELYAARRDAESKVRMYRKMPSWRFSLKPPDERRHEKLRQILEEQCRFLRRELDELERIITRWEGKAATRKPRAKRPSKRGQQAEFAFG